MVSRVNKQYVHTKDQKSNFGWKYGMARTFEFVLHFVGCVTVTVSPNQIIIIIIIKINRLIIIEQ